MEEDDEKDWPDEVYCGNTYRVASTLRAAGKRLGGQPADKRLPNCLELLRETRFVVLRATSHYAHLSVEPAVERDDLAVDLRQDSADILSRLRETISTEMESLGTDTEPHSLLIVSACGDVLAGDELTLVLSKALVDLRLVELRGVIATL